jgi:hypothetical protein
MRALCVVLSLASVKLTVVASAAHSLALHRVKKSPSKTTHQPPWLASGRLKRPRPRSRHLKTQDAETTDPLVTGIGTHFAYLWVGTPVCRHIASTHSLSQAHIHATHPDHHSFFVNRPSGRA